MTINELITIAHSDAKAKGWWDNERNLAECLMLIVSECGEALEAHRKGKRASLDEYEKASSMLGLPPDRVMSEDEATRTSFKIHIKDTFEDELADIVIRLADLCGGLKIKPDYQMPHFYGPIHEMEIAPVPSWGSLENVGAQLMRVTEKLVAMNFSQNTDSKLIVNNAALAFLDIMGMCAAHRVNISRHIELKLAYNRTRNYKHGKAY